ncbi:hypothetical protein EDD16DRAFT_1713864 [Pisolithus croceorrhizus]|nr:hypothetical protein EDD16DRAFT_1713864 [Pisolithus croceorrhizus]
MPFGCICEGMKDIDARITAPELASIALAKLTPKIVAFCPQFLWRPSEFVVCDSSWVDLSSVPEPMQPYFYHECLHPGSRKNFKTPVFKPKQFPLFVIIPESQWREYESHKLAEEEMSASDTEHPVSVHCPNPLTGPTSPPATASSFNTGAAAHLLSHGIGLVGI